HMSGRDISTAVVVTTISDGGFLDRLAPALRDAGARLIVIPDRNTGPALFAACERHRRLGLDVVCPSVAEQQDLLERLAVPDLIPYHSDNRRNVGYLMAWMEGFDVIVSMDDDNLPTTDDFVERHQVVCQGPRTQPVTASSDGWFNNCALLEVEPTEVFPRGFPFHARPAHAQARTSVCERPADVRINAGLWLGDPDVDAITRLAVRPNALAHSGGSVVLAEGTWCPVNSQNTAVHRDALPAYYFLRMGQPVDGVPMERFGDIFSGYFVQVCAQHLGHAVRFGDPVVEHPRNEHDLLDDLHKEVPAVRLLDDILDHLRDHPLEGGDYLETYESLSYALQEIAERVNGRAWSPDARAFLHRSAHLMRSWTGALRTVAGT
uniref:Transglycosylse n=1 Tax=Marinactinospora thermotolerans TaxID=531310 RepID=UPI0023F59762|nr:Chain A, Transglycosylse [Marinactinospora thermotolerans]7XPS_B Chain B, Transglycosylse [Marinactinospora thermotolerans]7XPT_A Chain A, Transglycosylse [Marinactinospora thermotolerans]7XPT_B Chain B, Transglycosylse [Marinactinospora thermotolerans]